jgi:hypothetical protein
VGICRRLCRCALVRVRAWGRLEVNLRLKRGGGFQGSPSGSALQRGGSGAADAPGAAAPGEHALVPVARGALPVGDGGGGEVEQEQGCGPRRHSLVFFSVGVGWCDVINVTATVNGKPAKWSLHEGDLGLSGVTVHHSRASGSGPQVGWPSDGMAKLMGRLRAFSHATRSREFLLRPPSRHLGRSGSRRRSGGRNGVLVPDTRPTAGAPRSARVTASHCPPRLRNVCRCSLSRYHGRRFGSPGTHVGSSRQWTSGRATPRSCSSTRRTTC